MPLPPLPADEIVAPLAASLAGHPNAVVVAPPGAGKTTRVPPALAAATYPGTDAANRAVVLLQPRRVAARAAAARIAFEQRWQLGEEVGYQIRFENRTSARTRVRVVTEGILTRQLQSDPFLEGVGCVILDEFHERSIHTDLAIALLREVQTTVRPDLRIVVMSATMDPAPVARFLGGAPVFESAGRLFPVTIDHMASSDARPIAEKAAEAVRLTLPESAGHVLVFLPGIGEIRRTQDLLGAVGAEVHVLHSSVSGEDQDRALAPSSRRKLILATNIAETSITIDGVTEVIDGGLARVLVHDARLGMDRLELRRISRASAGQRAGRAGRTGPGRCFRLWTRGEDEALEPAELPEVHRVDLAATVLSLHAYGTRAPRSFPWFEAPPAGALDRAEDLLRMLGAIDGRGLTPLGRRLASLPLHPRLGRMLVEGADGGVLTEAATLAALLSEKDVVGEGGAARRREAAHEADSDLLERLEMLERRAPGLDPAAVRAVVRVRDELVETMRRSRAGGGGARPPHADRHDALLRLPLVAYPDRVAVRRPQDPSRGTMVGGRGVVLEPSSVCRRSVLFLAIDPRDTVVQGRTEARVGLASAVDEAWLEELFPHLSERRITHAFDTARGKVITSRETLHAGLPVRVDTVGAQADPEGASAALALHVARNIGRIVEGDEEAAEWLARVALLRRAMPELELPAMDEGAMAGPLRDACAGETSLDVLRRQGFAEILSRALTHEQRRLLDRHAPTTLEVPSGSRIRLAYAGTRDNTPVLAVRLQELFGLPETPRVAAGRVPVLLHLLAPNHRPVQVTQDLRSFWNTTYAEVRKELRARYPRHPWPEDPWNAPPKAVGGRRRPPQS